MGYVKEPKGVDFVVVPKPLTKEDKKLISEVIAYYKATGRKKRIAGKRTRTNGRKKINSK